MAIKINPMNFFNNFDLSFIKSTAIIEVTKYVNVIYQIVSTMPAVRIK